MSHPYQVQDSMSLWWLADPRAPQRIGTLSLQDQRRKVALSYDPAWIASPQGFALSEDLPLQMGLCCLPSVTRQPVRWTMPGLINGASVSSV